MMIALKRQCKEAIMSFQRFRAGSRGMGPGRDAAGRAPRRGHGPRVESLEGKALLSAGVSFSSNGGPVTLPAAETLASLPVPSLAPADDSGTAGDWITNVNQPRLVGNATPGDAIAITTAGVTVLGQSTVHSDGSYSVRFASPLPDGIYAFRVQDLQSGGSAVAASNTFTLKIQTAIPPTPAAPVLLASDVTGPNDTTSVRRPHVYGQTEPGAVVELLNPAGNVLGTTTASILDGTFLMQPANDLPVGVDSVRYRAHDVAGNWGSPGASAPLRIVSARNDFDGAGKTDPAVFRPSTGQWIVQLSNGGVIAPSFGAPNLSNIPVPGDYDGVGHTEMAVFYPATATWSIQGASGGRTVAFGAPNLEDLPVPADYDGVGHAEIAVFRPSTAQWIIQGPNGAHVVQFGASGLNDIPVPGDYDGVGHAEAAVFRPSTGQFFVLGPNGGRAISFGGGNFLDVPVPGDYDGVGYDEPAVFRPSTGQWFVLGPNNHQRSFSFGATNLFDVPLEAPISSLVRLGLIGAPAPAAPTPPAQGALFVGCRYAPLPVAAETLASTPQVAGDPLAYPASHSGPWKNAKVQGRHSLSQGHALHALSSRRPPSAHWTRQTHMAR